MPTQIESVHGGVDVQRRASEWVRRSANHNVADAPGNAARPVACYAPVAVAAAPSGSLGDGRHRNPAVSHPLKNAHAVKSGHHEVENDEVDRFLIDSQSGGAHLELHEPHDAGDVLKFDDPWEGRFCCYATVIHDGPLYRLYYRGEPSYDTAHPELRPEVTCYAESADGMHWVKPKLGLLEFKGSKENNIILAGPRPFSHNFCPFLDTNPEAPSAQRYKAFSGGSDTGLFAFVSADGIHWHKLREEPVFPWKKEEHGLDSQNVAFWSESEQQYVMYYRHTLIFKPHDLPPYLRSIGRATSKDFLKWTDDGWMNYSDTKSIRPSVQLYTNQTSPYFRAPHIYLATAARFMEGRKVLTDEQAKQIDVDRSYFGDVSDSISVNPAIRGLLWPDGNNAWSVCSGAGTCGQYASANCSALSKSALRNWDAGLNHMLTSKIKA